jgi:hypothetical protein
MAKTKINDSQKKDLTNLTSEVSEVLPVANGGTNKSVSNLIAKRKGFMRVSATEDGYDFTGIFDSSATVSLVSGYNNNLALPAGSNNILVNGTFAKPGIITGIVSAGRLDGELITLRCNGGSFLIAMNHLRETSSAANVIYPAGGTSADTTINYVPVCRGQQAKLYFSASTGAWHLMDATTLMYSIPMKKGVSYTQQGTAVNISNVSYRTAGAGTQQSNSVPSVGALNSLAICSTGNTLNGGVSVLTGGAGAFNTSQYALGDNYIETQFQLVVETSPTATERFNMRLGLMNNITAPTVGIWASLIDNQNGGNWTFKCNNGGTVTVVNTVLAANIGATLLFSIIWNGHEAKLIQGGVVVATIPSTTLNFPKTQGCTPMMTIEKSIGLTPRRFYWTMIGLLRLETTL